MPRWTIDGPTTLDFDGVVALKIRVMIGTVSVLATDDDKPSLLVDEISGQPLLVTHQAGILTISYEDLTWEGLLRWLKPQKRSVTITVTVPRECPVELGVVSGTAVLSGLSARASVKSVAGGVVLDGVSGVIDSHTISGNLEAKSLNGTVNFVTIAGELTLAGGSLQRLAAKTVSGRVTADVELGDSSHLQIGTVSGDVLIRVPEAGGLSVDIRSTSGQVDTAFAGLTQTNRPGAKTVTGTVGAGSARLSVSTVSGSVSLLRRSDESAREPGGPRSE